jgi:cytochrome c5
MTSRAPIRDVTVCILLAAMLAGCDPGEHPGQMIWQNNCQACHGPGLAGAPRIGHRTEWAARLTQGTDTLIDHAIYGYAGPGGHEMPARGGNPSLTDTDIAAAVNYMISESR